MTAIPTAMDLLRLEASRLMRPLLVALSVAVILLFGTTVLLVLRVSALSTANEVLESRSQSLEVRLAELEQYVGKGQDFARQAAREAAARRKAISDGFKDMVDARLGGHGSKPLESPALPHAEAP